MSVVNVIRVQAWLLNAFLQSSAITSRSFKTRHKTAYIVHDDYLVAMPSMGSCRWLVLILKIILTRDMCRSSFVP